jgi:hypothetical protein
MHLMDSQQVLDLNAYLRLASELFDISHASRPANLEQIRLRMKHNFRHSATNYVAIFVTIAAYSLLTNWKLLIEVTFVAFVLRLGRDDNSVNIDKSQFTASHIYALYLTALLVLLKSSLLSTLFSIVGTSSIIMLAHACLTDINHPKLTPLL